MHTYVFLKFFIYKTSGNCGNMQIEYTEFRKHDIPEIHK